MENSVNDLIKQFIVIKFENELYGINIKYIQNIIRMQGITRVPRSPVYIKGVINLRGEIIPVMSLRVKFNLAEDNYTNSTRIIIIEMEQSVMGLIVDEVREVIEIPDSSIEKIVGDSTDEKSSYIQGVGKIGNELITILNLNSIINEKKE